MEHRCSCQDRSDEWRETWSRWDIAYLLKLCSLCARNTVDAGTRWSWLACGMCREVNLAIRDIVGADRGVLPLGRHSLMNGLGLRGSPKVSDEVFEDFARSAPILRGR